MAAKADKDELIGQTIAGRYRIISRLGFGGMGVAYRAWDEKAGVPVVIKMPHKRFLEDPTFAERSIREARVMQGLVHQHVVPVVDVGEHEGLLFLVMRFLPGGSLSNRRLRDEKGKAKPNPPGMLHLWLPAVADALDYIHSRGVIHRDMKPANIFFDAGWGACVGDFGIAKIIAESEVFEREQTLTATGMGIGTPEYMAPEQFAPKAVVDGRADQYALAVIVYEMLAGVRPFTGESANLILEVLTQPAPRLNEKRSGLPLSLIAAVDRGLSKRPADRFSTCREFATAVLQDVPPIDNEPDVVRLLCPKCANLLKLPRSAAGRKGKCPKCQMEMKVADDLGAMWLLDEARRQEDAANVGGFEVVTSAARSDQPSLETFRSLAVSRPIGKTTRRARQGILGWIDGHGLTVGATLAIAALIPWLLLSRDMGNRKPREDMSASRVQAEKKALEKQLTEAGELVKSLKKDLVDSRATVAELKGQLAALHSQPSPQPTDSSTVDVPQELTNSIGMKFMFIKAGTFQMGSEADGDPEETPVHEVRITQPFYLGIYEVTNSQWMAVNGRVPSKWKDDDLPVERMTWHEAVAFCKKLSEQPDELVAGRTYRLPTEAEWEYACRGGTTTRWSFGNDEADLEHHAWFLRNAGGQPHRVGQKKPNRLGLFDMHGNVGEWCSDWLGKYPNHSVTDPLGPPEEAWRAGRGGSWSKDARHCWATHRGYVDPKSSWDSLGVRLVLTKSSLEVQQKSQGKADTGDAPAATKNTGDATTVAQMEVEPAANASAQEILAKPPLKNSIGIELKLLPAGTFQMGSNEGEADEKPVHEVRITRPFYLGVTEVTNAQWKAVMGSVPSRWNDDDRPVEQIGWEDAVRFCEKLSQLPAEKAAEREYRLPTEAEWEYACRAGTTTEYSCGQGPVGLGECAWFGDNSGREALDAMAIWRSEQANYFPCLTRNECQTHPVGRKIPNAFGLHDTHGNVWEWCADSYGPYSAVTVSDPKGPPAGSFRVSRGGGWRSIDRHCRSTQRDRVDPSRTIFTLGLRVALDCEQSKAR